jgi:hypothetical protein
MPSARIEEILQMLVLGTLTPETFRSEVGKIFTADTVPKPIKLQLVRMHEGRLIVKGFRMPFTLIFATPRNTLLIEGFYDLKSESGREFRQIMLSPILSTGEHQEYQAVFN